MYFYLLIYLGHFGSIWGIFRPCALTNSSWRCNWFNLKIMQSFWVFGFGALRDGTSHLQSSLSHTRVSVLGYTQASSDIREIFTVDSIPYVTYSNMACNLRVLSWWWYTDCFFCFHDNKLASFIQTLFLRDEVIPQMTAGNSSNQQRPTSTAPPHVPIINTNADFMWGWKIFSKLPLMSFFTHTVG